jgi:hypothetical protein
MVPLPVFTAGYAAYSGCAAASSLYAAVMEMQGLGRSRELGAKKARRTIETELMSGSDGNQV